MNLLLTFELVIKEFQKQSIDFAVIGGLALQQFGVNRTTDDIDFLILVSDKDKVNEVMIKLGYELKHESTDILNFFSKDSTFDRIDFLIAHRQYALAMLERAVLREVLGGKCKIKFLKAEDQIGLKVQSSTNDPERYHQDLADIEKLIEYNYDSLDMNIIREYFKIFNREEELNMILKRVKC